ncbi:MAG: TIGR01906 family membrane protein [Leptolinea sp.]|jgi:integral membrane protein (TIGR01906 family)|nr:TIGR01906 family membrane protein [Leptolinea sp.]
MTLPQKITTYSITILVPIFLLMTSIRLLLFPVYTILEYQRPGFPPDTYGFTLQDRLKWSQVSLDYLSNGAGIEFLADQKLDASTPLYNERELSHMLDVKKLVQLMLIIWPLIGIFILGAGVLAMRGGWLPHFWQAVSRGGWAAVGLILAILVAVMVSFNALFTGFHRIFFSGDTWLFQYSDTLIRLFPMPFWQDAFTVMGALVLLGGLFLGLFGRKQSYAG